MRYTTSPVVGMSRELLCRIGDLKGPETGGLFRVGYTSASQERRHLRNRLSHDRDAQHIYSSNSLINVTIEELTPLTFQKKEVGEMKKCTFIVVIGCLFLIPTLAQAQVEKMIDQFLQRGESRVRPEDLRVVQLEIFPDPVRQGQRVSFRVTITNASRHPGRVTLAIKDRDEVISEARDVDIRPGENRIDFLETAYRFSRSDHCFTVEADIEHTRRSIDVAREFCARKTSRGWSLTDRVIGPLYVEDLDMNPDPAIPGQGIRFKVRLRNDGRPIRASILIQDKDQVVVQVENVTIPRGYSDFQFPYTLYSFKRFDHCFTVQVDFERTPYPVDAVREFCAKPMGWTLRP